MAMGTISDGEELKRQSLESQGSRRACLVHESWLSHVICCVGARHKNKVIFESRGLPGIRMDVNAIRHLIPEQDNFMTIEHLLWKVVFLVYHCLELFSER
ncbi:hypothetical protein M514_21849 [Trichuris suis]|uniref:Uncharacterized protein n=1 Tax=Trichuris suis TaxID=68888 RepID=A0A085N980_9BILA|nr:hypothetical protein M514_21849 [Trichuris suis]